MTPEQFEQLRTSTLADIEQLEQDVEEIGTRLREMRLRLTQAGVDAGRTVTLPSYKAVSGLLHGHRSTDGWLEHDHLGGGWPHRHDPQTGGQIRTPAPSIEISQLGAAAERAGQLHMAGMDYLGAMGVAADELSQACGVIVGEQDVYGVPHPVFCTRYGPHEVHSATANLEP